MVDAVRQDVNKTNESLVMTCTKDDLTLNFPVLKLADNDLEANSKEKKNNKMSADNDVHGQSCKANILICKSRKFSVMYKFTRNLPVKWIRE